MNYPVWEVPILGGGMLIGAIAILHVFVAHFAVGGGLYLVLTERRAYRTADEGLLHYLQGHYASLCRPQPPPRSGADCSCLDGPSPKTARLPGAALVKRAPGGKS